MSHVLASRTTTARPCTSRDQAPALGDDGRPSSCGCRPRPESRQVHVRTTPDGEPRFSPRPSSTAPPDGGACGGGPRSRCATRSPTTGSCSTGPGTRWLTARRAGRPRRAGRHRLPAGRARPAAGLGRGRGGLPDLPGPVRPLGRGRLPRPLPDWAIPCDWDTPVIGRGPETPRQFYGGDLDGIAERPGPHRARSASNTVYLTPIFPARSNHRYDAAAFDQVDPLLGGDEALARLADAVHARGMRLLGDITTNHTGDAHEWFTAAADATRPSGSCTTSTPDGEYESWLGRQVAAEAELGQRRAAPPVRRRPRLAARAGCAAVRLDGWRVDVANMTGRRGADDVHPRGGARCCAGRSRRPGRTRCWSPSTATTPPATWTATAGTAR